MIDDRLHFSKAVALPRGSLSETFSARLDRGSIRAKRLVAQIAYRLGFRDLAKFLPPRFGIVVFRRSERVGVEVVREERIESRGLARSKISKLVDVAKCIYARFLSEQRGRGTSFEGQDAFVQQFLQNQEQGSELSTFTNKIVSIPDLLILGINQDVSESDLAIYKALLTAFILIILAVVIFVAFFGDGRIT